MLALVVAVSAPAAVGAAENGAEAVHHRISFPRRATQYVHVESRFQAEDDVLDLNLPSWTPGSYLIRDYAGHVERFSARSSSGVELSVAKTSKNTWRIQAAGNPEVVVGYDVWAGSLSVQDSWIESDFALLNGASIFMYTTSGRKAEQLLQLELPSEWQDVNVALPASGSSRQFRARDFDELVDSPLLIGNTENHPFAAGEAQFSLVTQGETRQFAGDEAARDLARIAMAEIDFWGVNPFDRDYLFINVLLGGRGGLEHDHSTVMMAAPSVMRVREEYVKWMALASHELFHAWNVRRMRPIALADYDYSHEVYTSQLWLAEGLTSYYDNMLLFRAGVITVQELFELLAVEMQQYELQPGRLELSAEEASFDSWIRQYKPSANAVNNNSNYYRKGSLIGFVLDTAIRQESRGRSSLDDALREMYRRYGASASGPGSYPPGALAEIVAELSSPEVASMLDSLLTTPTDPDIDAALDWHGLVLVRAPDRQAAEAGGVPVPVDLGATFRQDTPQLLVESVLHGGAAADAGLLPGDELLAINGHRVTREDHEAYLKTFRPGETASLTVVRHQRLRTLEVVIQNAISNKYLITTKERVSGREEQRLERWLGRRLHINQ